MTTNKKRLTEEQRAKVAQWLPLVQRVVKTLPQSIQRLQSNDEWLSAGVVGLCNAVTLYREEVGTEQAYFTTCIYNELVREADTLKKGGLTNLSVNGVEGPCKANKYQLQLVEDKSVNGDIEGRDIEEQAKCNKEVVRALINQSGLSEGERKAMELHLGWAPYPNKVGKKWEVFSNRMKALRHLAMKKIRAYVSKMGGLPNGC